MTSPANLATSDQLVPIIQKSTGRPVTSVGEVVIQQIGTGGGIHGGIYRYSGIATEKNGEVPWSIILKVLSSHNPSLPADTNDPASWGYWKREAEIYTSDLLDDLPMGLSVPRICGSEEQADGTIWLWLEEIQDDHSSWTPDLVRRAARLAGLFNGQYLVRKKIPDRPWLSRNWLRNALAENAVWISKLRQNLNHPVIQQFFPPDIAEMVFHVWDRRKVYLKALDRLPQTLCHMDYFVRNLVPRQGPQGEEFVVFDWAYTGVGAVGEEIAPLVIGSLALLGIDMKFADSIEKEAIAGYTAGLVEAGWQGEPDLVWAGYSLSGALRYSCGILNVILPMYLNPAIDINSDTPFGMKGLQFADHVRKVNRRFNIRLASEADHIASSI